MAPIVPLLSRLAGYALVLAVLAWSAVAAYKIRLYAIETYGRVIHEFDPWFNFRATQYLQDHGIAKFFTWFDYMSWYPLGRPVGTTIYPGMQLTSVAIFRVLKSKYWRLWLGLKPRMSLNDVCVFVPAWFGTLATLTLALLTREVSGSWRAAAAAAAIMAIIPAHIMRSVGGGYDNESVAMTAMVLTFFTWTRSLRTARSWPIGVVAGLAYAYMVAAWGGFIFVGNMVGIHAAALVLLGHYSSQLHLAYSLWYVVGTAGAVQVPVVGMSPFRSLEQLGPCAVFFGLQILALCDAYGKSKGLNWKDNYTKMFTIRVQAGMILGAIGAAGLAVIIPTGYFGPLSVRVRSLFIKHTRTGNPLVDSVAEHQPASSEAYWQYLHYAYYLAPIGLGLVLFEVLDKTNTRKAGVERASSGVSVSKWFIILYAIIAYYFANRMQRLIILLGPVASALSGVTIAFVGEWVWAQVCLLPEALGGAAFAAAIEGSTAAEDAAAPAAVEKPAAPAAPAAAAAAEGETSPTAAATPKAKAAALAKTGVAKKGKGGDASAAPAAAAAADKNSPLEPLTRMAKALYDSRPVRVVRIVAAGSIVALAFVSWNTFYGYSDNFSHQMSQPSIMFKARLNDGKEVMINDYQEAYWWLRDNTPLDSRVLSWWDYGYQISGIGNRTTLADGNTWNLEHIALLGRILTSPEKRAHALARHLADYVLIWAGNSGDDLAKSPHMARIGSSVYPDICPKDPLCRSFGFYSDRKPTDSMAASMLYKMHSAGRTEGVRVNPKLFQEAYSSKYGLVRIYKVLNISQESKQWLANPANRHCDRPGSWYCPGDYPPGLDRPPSSHRNLDYDDPNRYVEEQH